MSANTAIITLTLDDPNLARVALASRMAMYFSVVFRVVPS